METVELLIDVTHVGVAFIAGFLGFHFLFLRQGNRKSNVLLGIFLLLTGVGAAHQLLFDEESINALGIALGLLNSPFLVLLVFLNYAQSLTGSFIVRRPWNVVLFVFPLADTIIALLFETMEDKLSQMFVDVYVSIMIFLLPLFTIFVNVLILRVIKKHNDNMLSLFSSLENKQLNWLKTLVFINIGFEVIWLTDDSLALMIGDNVVSETLAIVSFLGTLISVLWIGFAGLRQAPVFTAVDLNTTDSEVEADHKDWESAYTELVDRLKKEQFYLNENLSLGELGKLVDHKPKDLTRIIHAGFNDSFYHFINHFRVEHFKDLRNQSENAHLSIEGLSQESGFKSKSTFYSAFRKFEGMTPLQYDSQKKSSNDVS